MAFQKNKVPRYAKGFSEATVYDITTGDVLYWTNKLKTGNISTSMNEGAVEGGLGNKLLMNIIDTVRVTGTFEAADFSLEARGLQMGSTVQYNAKSLIREKITATDTTLRVTKTPASGYGQSSTAETYYCYVGSDSVNYGVNPTTKEIQGFTAEVGKEYCVQYYTNILNAESLAIPANFSPTVAYMVIKTPIYSENGASAKNSSLAGHTYTFLPRVQFVGGDAGINGSQTETSTTSLSFTSLAYDEITDEICTECGNGDSVYGYMTYVPCNTEDMSGVKALVVINGGVSVAVGSKVQLPVFYYMDNGQLVTPTYTDLTYASANEETATVATNGQVTGVAAGSTTITITVTAKPSLKIEASVVVTGA